MLTFMISLSVLLTVIHMSALDRITRPWPEVQHARVR